MAQLDQSGWISKWISNITGLFKDNTTGDITEETVRTFSQDTWDSFVDRGAIGQAEGVAGLDANAKISDSAVPTATTNSITAAQTDATQAISDAAAAQSTADGKPDNLSELDDTTISGPSNNQVLTYNSTSGKWENQASQSGGATELNGLNDVTISGPANGELLVFNSTSGDWENAADNPAIQSAQADATQAISDAAAAQSTANAAQPESEKGAANGYAPLDASSDVPKANLPSDTVYQAALDTTNSNVTAAQNDATQAISDAASAQADATQALSDAAAAQSTADAAQPESEKNAANGYAGLDANTKLNPAQYAPETGAGTAIAFDSDKIYGEPTALTGTLTKDLTGAVEGTVAYIHHNDASDPNLSANGFTVISGTYTTGVANYIYMNFVGGTKVIATIGQEQ